MRTIILLVLALVWTWTIPFQVTAASQAADTAVPAEEKENTESADRRLASLTMLASIIELKANLETRIAEKKQALAKSESETEKAGLKAELEKLDKNLAGANLDFERIATGVDIGLFAAKKAEQFNWKDELVSLVEPGIMELKRLTVKARQKTKLKDELSFYQDLVPVARDANENLDALIQGADDKTLKKNLKNLKPEWQSLEEQILNKLKIVQMQLTEMEADEVSLIETSQASMKNFFRTRGLFLFIALVSCIVIVLAIRFAYTSLIRWVPGYASKYRPFHIRALDLAFRVVTLIATLFVLILVFYIFEDWVLLSLTIIALMGVGWAAKHTLPRFWHQSRLMLNIGAVREGERIVFEGVPWLVKRINVFTRLENPDLEEVLRVPIETLMDKSSRPFAKNESWFPCRKNDWVILGDGTRGCVVSLSHEMVELVLRGGAKKVYQTGDFLGLSPLNLSVNFRLKITFGIGYGHQDQATGPILETLDRFIRARLSDEGYEDALKNLRVEFAAAGASSLDLVVIADFDGEMAPLYNRINRAIQRWCTDACTENGWDIPFPQLTVHRPD